MPPIPRSRLDRLLEDALASGTVLVSGIAGAGKSTAVRLWVEAAPLAYSWLGLDDRDDDPVRFWGRIGEALTGTAWSASGGVTRDRLDEWLALVPRMRRVLVLDDLHDVRDAALHEQLAYFVERMPEGLGLVLISRAPLPVALMAARAAARLAEVRGEELAFTRAELVELFADRRELVDPVCQVTRGWAIAVAMSRELVERRASADIDWEAPRRDAASFLAREVLGTLPEELQEFVCDVAVLDELTAEVADAALEIDDAAARFARLSELGVFLAPAADGWTMHAVVRDALRSELDRRSPHRARHLSIRASRYYESRDVAHAIGYALEGDDFARAAELIEEHRAELPEVRYALQLRWFQALPEQVVRSRPVLRAHAVTVASYERRPDLVARWLRESGSARADSVDDLGALTVHCIRIGDLPRLAEVAGRLHVQLDEGHPLWRLSCGALTGALVAVGDREGALGVITSMLRPVVASPVQFLALQSTGRAVATILLSELGRREQARTSLAALREWTAEASLVDGYADLVAVNWATARLALDEGDPDAGAAWHTAPPPEAAFGLPFLDAWLAIDFAAARLAARDHDAARHALHRAQMLLGRFVDAGEFGARLRAVGTPLGIVPLVRREPVRTAPVELSERELTVLQLLDGELSAREIAEYLFVSPNTLKSHVRSVYRKLGVNSRHSAVRSARERGLIHPVG